MQLNSRLASPKRSSVSLKTNFETDISRKIRSESLSSSGSESVSTFTSSLGSAALEDQHHCAPLIAMKGHLTEQIAVYGTAQPNNEHKIPEYAIANVKQIEKHSKVASSTSRDSCLSTRRKIASNQDATCNKPQRTSKNCRSILSSGPKAKRNGLITENPSIPLGEMTRHSTPTHRRIRSHDQILPQKINGPVRIQSLGNYNGSKGIKENQTRSKLSCSSMQNDSSTSSERFLIDKLWPSYENNKTSNEIITIDSLLFKQKIAESEVADLLKSTTSLIAFLRQKQQVEVRKLRGGLWQLTRHCGKLTEICESQLRASQQMHTIKEGEGMESKIHNVKREDHTVKGEGATTSNQTKKRVISQNGHGRLQSSSGTSSPETGDVESTLAASVDQLMKQATDQIEKTWKTRFDKIQAEHQNALTQERERAKQTMTNSTKLVSELLHEKDASIKELREECGKLEMQKRHADIDLDAAHKELNLVRSHLQAFDQELTTNAATFWQKTTDLAKHNRILAEEVAQSKQTITKLNERIDSLQLENKDVRQENSTLVKSLQDLDTSHTVEHETFTAMEQKFENEKARREKFQVSVEQLTVENTALYAQMVALQTTHEARMEELRIRFEQKHECLLKEVSQLRNHNRLIQQSRIMMNDQENPEQNQEASMVPLPISEKSTKTTQQIEEMAKELLILRADLDAKSGKINVLEKQVLESELSCRKLRNTIQELRGNIRVHVRLRPFLPSDGAMSQENTAPALICDVHNSTMSASRENQRPFSFDKVYDQSSTQECVFQDVSDFIQSAVDGYNVCILAYGQTGSGKTHTMQGSGKTQMRGIIPRSIELIIQSCENLTLQGWVYSLYVQYFEIYNDTIKDLLLDAKAGSSCSRKYQIRTTKKGKNYVEGLVTKEIDVNMAHEQLDEIVKLAACNRSVERTDMNAQSSRSHSIFLLMLRGTNESQSTEIEGSLSLVDLAGSERLSRSNVTGDRMKEAQAINKSLSSLADVFQALAKKSPHVPYRNSKLTYVLQPSLSADGKTLMMVNLSPTFVSLEESLCSLRFAQQVNHCELGNPVRQIKVNFNSTIPSISRTSSTNSAPGSATDSLPSSNRSGSTKPSKQKSTSITCRFRNPQRDVDMKNTKGKGP